MRPSAANGIVGIKPTVGLTSRAGVVPISHTQDTVGPHARTVTDAATVLSAIAESGTDYRQFLVPDGLQRSADRHRPQVSCPATASTPTICSRPRCSLLRSLGAELVDEVEIPGQAQLREELAGARARDPRS